MLAASSSLCKSARKCSTRAGVQAVMQEMSSAVSQQRMTLHLNRSSMHETLA